MQPNHSSLGHSQIPLLEAAVGRKDGDWMEVGADNDRHAPRGGEKIQKWPIFWVVGFCRSTPNREFKGFNSENPGGGVGVLY